MTDEIENINMADDWAAPAPLPVEAVYLSEPAKEAKMADLANGDIIRLALAAASNQMSPRTTIENASTQLPIAETLLAAGKVMTDRARKEWKEDAEAHDLSKVDYPATGLRVQIVKGAKAPSATPEALAELRKTNPVLFSQIAKNGVHMAPAKKAELQKKIDRLQGELLKAQAEMEAADLYDEPQLIDDDKAIAKALEQTPWDGVEWKAKRADSVREGSIPKKK